MNGALLAASVAGSGGVGAALRLAVDATITRRWPNEVALGTITVNVAGSLLAGLLAGAALAHGLNPEVRAVVVTGLCGGLTTWSTAMFETVRLLRSRRGVAALVVGVGGFAASIGAAAIGLVLVGA